MTALYRFAQLSILLFVSILATSVFAADVVSNDVFALNAGDVSVLFPLPTPTELHSALSAGVGSVQGMLIPLSVLEKLPNLVASRDTTTTYARDLKVVAFRIDPCFQEGISINILCRRQIRMVWQPLATRGNSVFATDAAVHTFYDLTEKDWQEFLTAYNTLQTTCPRRETSISVNDMLRVEGYSGSYWARLRALLLTYCGEKSLSRVTLMTLDFNETQWVFRGYDISQAGSLQQKLTAIKIPKTQATSQVVATRELNGANFQMTIFPFAQSETALWFYDNSNVVASHFKEVDIKTFFESELRLEDPRTENTGTTDCVSCHLAMETVKWGQLNYPGWNLVRSGSSSPVHAEPLGLATSRLRAFGYDGQIPVISPRVRNETERVLKFLRESKNQPL